MVKLPRHVRTNLECPICKDILKEAEMTDCGHTFCSGCISDWHQTSCGKSCPTCNREIQNISPCYALRDIIQSYKRPEQSVQVYAKWSDKLKRYMCADCGKYVDNDGICTSCCEYYVVADCSSRNAILKITPSQEINPWKRSKKRDISRSFKIFMSAIDKFEGDLTKIRREDIGPVPMGLYDVKNMPRPLRMRYRELHDIRWTIWLSRLKPILTMFQGDDRLAVLDMIEVAVDEITVHKSSLAKIVESISENSGALESAVIEFLESTRAT